MLEIFAFVFLFLPIMGALLYWRTYTYQTTAFGAPFVPLEPDVVEHVMKLADIKPGQVFYELGSGDGRVVVAAALRGATAYGIEIDRFRVLYSRLWIKLLRLNKRAQILHENIFQVNLSNANIVFMYLLQTTNEALQQKLLLELKPGTKIISVAFTFPGWKPKTIDPHGSIYGPIYLYER